MEFDWSLLISFVSLCVSIWTAAEVWLDKQPRLFVTDVNAEIFTNFAMSEAYIRLDLTLNVQSARPLPIYRASVSMGKGKLYACTHRSPTPRTLEQCNAHAQRSNQKLEAFFGPGIKLPATLPPSSAQHICLWLTLPIGSEFLRNLQAALAAPEESQDPSSTESKCRSSESSPHLEEEHSCAHTFETHQLFFLFRSGEHTLLSSVLIDSSSSVLLLD